ncbi:molecular chaperone DnaJ [Flavobacterium oreochromis]|uniref:molecular chaperone DnaJ n=1 Tax=Flavobacterium oreochromis TaxID=2906078 RepID=UPI00385EFB35
MNNPIAKDTLKLASKVVKKTGTLKTDEQYSWWIFIIIGVFICIVIYLLLKKRNKENVLNKQFKRDSLKEEIDFDNIIKSSFHSKQIYDELKRRCHPDRFPDDIDKKVIADKLFQEITENKNNIKRLIELKEYAIQKLNINF